MTQGRSLNGPMPDKRVQPIEIIPEGLVLQENKISPWVGVLEGRGTYPPMRPHLTTSKTSKAEALGEKRETHDCSVSDHGLEPHCLGSNPDPSLSSCVALGKLLNLSVPS